MSKKHHKTSWQGLNSLLLSSFLFIWLLRWINEDVVQVLQKSQKITASYLGYHKVIVKFSWLLHMQIVRYKNDKLTMALKA